MQFEEERCERLAQIQSRLGETNVGIICGTREVQIQLLELASGLRGFRVWDLPHVLFCLSVHFCSWLLLEARRWAGLLARLVGFCFASGFVSVLKNIFFLSQLCYLLSILMSGNYKNFNI